MECSNKEYKLVADLIIDVITSKITAAFALSKFPKSDDINIKCAFDAIVHYEADEDQRAKIDQYAELQDEYLQYIADTLSHGQQLPKDIVMRYNEYHSDNVLPNNKKGFASFVDYLKRIINF